MADIPPFNQDVHKVDPQTGRVTPEFLQWLQELVRVIEGKADAP